MHHAAICMVRLFIAFYHLAIIKGLCPVIVKHLDFDWVNYSQISVKSRGHQPRLIATPCSAS